MNVTQKNQVAAAKLYRDRAHIGIPPWYPTENITPYQTSDVVWAADANGIYSWKAYTGGSTPITSGGIGTKKSGSFDIAAGVPSESTIVFDTAIDIPYVIQFFDITDPSSVIQNFTIKDYVASGFTVTWNAPSESKTITWVAMNVANDPIESLVIPEGELVLGSSAQSAKSTSALKYNELSGVLSINGLYHTSMGSGGFTVGATSAENNAELRCTPDVGQLLLRSSAAGALTVIGGTPPGYRADLAAPSMEFPAIYTTSTSGIDIALGSEYKINGIAHTHSQYITSAGDLSNYATSASLSQYETSAAHNASIANYATSASLSNYATSAHIHSVVTSAANGFSSSADKSKLDSIATSANNYSLPVATSVALGGVKQSTNVSIDASGFISVSFATLEPTVSSGTSAQWYRGDKTWSTLLASDIPNLDVSKLTSGTIASARLGSGSATSATYLAGDNVWRTISGSGTIGGSIAATQIAIGSGANTISGDAGLTYGSSTITSPNFNVASGGKYKENGTIVFDFAGTGNTVIGKNCGGTLGQYNMVAGDGSLASATSATLYCVAFGHNALNACTNSHNSFAGAYGGRLITSGTCNCGLGSYNAYSLVDGNYNTTLGYGNLFNAVSVTGNICIGHQTGYNCASDYNVMIGMGCGDSIANGGGNVVIGWAAMYQGSMSITSTVAIGKYAAYNGAGNNCVYIGSYSGFSNLYNGNTAIGESALMYATGGNNTIVGSGGAGYQCVSACVMIGYQAGNGETGSNKLYIANSSTATPLIYGDFATGVLRVNTKLGVNTSASTYNLEVSGDANVTGSFRVNGTAMVSDKISYTLTFTDAYATAANTAFYRGGPDIMPTKYKVSAACSLIRASIDWATAPTSAYKIRYSKNAGAWTDFNTSTIAANTADATQAPSSAITLASGDTIEMSCDQVGTSVALTVIFQE